MQGCGHIRTLHLQGRFDIEAAFYWLRHLACSMVYANQAANLVEKSTIAQLTLSCYTIISAFMSRSEWGLCLRVDWTVLITV
jgi:hypothetical protein